MVVREGLGVDEGGVGGVDVGAFGVAVDVEGEGWVCVAAGEVEGGEGGGGGGWVGGGGGGEGGGGGVGGGGAGCEGEGC